MHVAGGQGGWLRGYVDHARSVTDAPAIFHVGAGLVALAGAVGSAVSWRGGGNRESWPNLFVLVLAPSGIYRKSTSVDLGVDLLQRACPGVVLDREFSPERFVRNLAAHPTSVLKESEFSSLLERMKSSYMQGMKQRLTDLYDCQAEYTRTIQGPSGGAGEKITIARPALSILAASTLDWLVESLTETDMRSGFMPRFLFFAASQKEPEPPGGYWAEADRATEARLVGSLATLSRLEGSRVSFAPCHRRVVGWVAEHVSVAETEDVPEELMGLYSRLGHHLAKLCVLLQISDDGPSGQYEVRLETAERAITLLEWVLAGTERVFEERIVFSKFERLVQRILALTGEQGADKRDVLRRLKIPVRELDAALQTLAERGEVEVTQAATGGRPRTTIQRVRRPSDAEVTKGDTGGRKWDESRDRSPASANGLGGAFAPGDERGQKVTQE